MAENAAVLGQRSTSVAAAQQLPDTSVTAAEEQHSSSFTAPCVNIKSALNKRNADTKSSFLKYRQFAQFGCRERTTDMAECHYFPSPFV